MKQIAFPSHRSNASLAFMIEEYSAAQYELNLAQAHLAGEQLFHQGSFPQGVYFIDSGYVKLCSVDRDGRQLIVGLRSTGSILGASAVILQKPYLLSATTITTCTLRYISARTFIPLLKSDVRFSWHIQQEQSRETYERITRIVQLGCCSARHRFGQLLWDFILAMPMCESEKEVCLELPLKQWEVAQLIAITPEHLNRIVKQMRQDGILQWEKSKVIISDLRKLQHLIEL